MCDRFITVLLPFYYRFGVVLLSFFSYMGYLIICIGPFFYRFMLITDLEISCWSLARHACMYSIGVGASCPQDGQLMGCAEYLMGWIG